MNKSKLATALGQVDSVFISESAPDKVKENKKGRPLYRTVLSAAAAVAILLFSSATVYAAATYDLSFIISSRLGGEIEMLDSITAVPLNVSYSGNNETAIMKVAGITADRNNAYIWVEMTFPTAVLAHYGDNAVLTFDELSTGSASAIRHAAITCKIKDNTCYFGISFSQTDGNSLIGRRVAIKFKNIGIMTETDGKTVTQPLASGNWQAKFSIAVPDMTVSYNPEVKGGTVSTPENAEDAEWQHGTTFNDKVTDTITLNNCSIELSALSIRIEMTYTDKNNALFEASRKLILCLSDGSEAECLINDFEGSYYAEKNEGTKVVTTTFYEPVNPENITAVKYGGLYIPLE